MARKTKTTAKKTRAQDTERERELELELAAPVLGDDDDDAQEDDAQPGTAGLIGPDGRLVGVMSARQVGEKLKTAGKRLKHVGGSLPLLNDKTAFRRAGDCVLVRFVGITEPEAPEAVEEEDEDGKKGKKGKGKKAEFNFLTLDVLDQDLWDETGDADASAVYRAQMVNSTALRPWASDPKNVGAVVHITYMGDTETRRGQSKLKLYAISETV